MASLTPLSGPLGLRQAKHLLRRTTWKVNRTRIDQFANLTADEAVTQLLTIQPTALAQPVDFADGLPWINPPATTTTLDPQLRYVVLGWWTDEAMKDESIGSKMMFFMHQSFITSVITTGVGSANYFDYLQLLRFYAVGNVKKLALKMITDNTMLRYLNNNTNTATSPNENFAREFMELFTIQKGDEIATGDYTTYTENDVIEAAKVLTGFRTQARYDANGVQLFPDPETGLTQGQPKIALHNKTTKQFSAHFGNKTIAGATTAAGMWTELSEFVNMIFEQDATAQSYVRRLYRFFVSRFVDAEIENDIIAPLAVQLKADGYDLKNVLKTLLTSQHFYDADDSANNDEIIGGFIKSPVELVLQTMTMFDVKTPDLTVLNSGWQNFWFGSVQNVMFGSAGLNLFIPSDVAGYPAFYQQPDFNRSWFNSSTIVCRYNIGQMLLTGKRVITTGNLGGAVTLDLAAWLKNSGTFTNVSDAESLVQQFLEYMLIETPTPDRFDYFLNEAFADSLPLTDWTYEWNKYASGGAATEVKLWLSRLFNAIVYAPEYQVF